MSGMFDGTLSETLDLSNFNTSKVTDMSGMFSYCSLKKLDLSSFDMNNVVNTSDMFRGSSATIGYARTSLDADKLNASGNKATRLTFEVK